MRTEPHGRCWTKIGLGVGPQSEQEVVVAADATQFESNLPYFLKRSARCMRPPVREDLRAPQAGPASPPPEDVEEVPVVVDGEAGARSKMSSGGFAPIRVRREPLEAGRIDELVVAAEKADVVAATVIDRDVPARR